MARQLRVQFPIEVRLGVRYSAIGNRMAAIQKRFEEDEDFRRKITECKVKT
jgi:hypothetical protein